MEALSIYVARLMAEQIMIEGPTGILLARDSAT